LYPFLDSEYFEFVEIHAQLEASTDNLKGLDIEISLELEARTGVTEIIDLNAYRTKTFCLPSGVYRILLDPVNPNQKNPCFFNIKYGSRRPLHIKGNRSSPFLINTKEGEMVTFECGLLESKDFTKYQDFSYKRPGNNAPFTLKIQQLQGQSYIITYTQTSKIVFNEHFTRMLRYYVNERNVEAIANIEKSAKANSLTKIKNNAHLLKKKLDDEDKHKKDLKEAIQQRSHSLVIEQFIKEAEAYNNDPNTSDIFKSRELVTLIEQGKEIHSELVKERDFIDEVKELLVTLWIEVKKKRDKFDPKLYIQLMQSIYYKGKELPHLKSYYFFILEMWYLSSEFPPSIDVLTRVQYNCYVYQMMRTSGEKKDKMEATKELAKLDPKFTLKSTEEDIEQRKVSGDLLKSYFRLEPEMIYYDKKEKIGRLFMKAEEDLLEKIVAHIIRQTQFTIKRLHEDQINHPRDMSQYIIDGDYESIQSLLEISTIFSESEIDRAQRITKAIQMRNKDYSDELNQIEIESIFKSKKLYLLEDPEAESIFQDMTHLQIVKFLKAKDWNIHALISDRVIIPEILFIGDTIKFEYPINSLVDSKLISEIAKVGKEITNYMRRKKELDPSLTIHEILTEQAITSDFKSKNNNQFTSEVDQYIRKRLIPVLRRILNHGRKDETMNAFDILDKVITDKRINKLKKHIKESVTLENLWTKDDKTLAMVRLRILICMCLNKQLLDSLFNALFHEDLSAHYKRNSFMRIQDARNTMIRLLYKFNKFPFSLVTTMERNEYTSELF
jgi:hypothetical protein